MYMYIILHMVFAKIRIMVYVCTSASIYWYILYDIYYTFKHMHNMELQSAWLMVITLMCDK